MLVQFAPRSRKAQERPAMNIAMATHYFESHRGGVEIAAGQLARALTALGHTVTWMACNSSPPPVDAAVCRRAISLQANNWLERRIGIPYPVTVPGTWQQIDVAIGDADLVLVHDAFFLPCRLMQRRARRAAKPCVIIQHIGVVPYRNPLLRLGMATSDRVLTRPALSAAAQVVFISELTRQHFEGTRYQRPPVVLFNGVDTATFTPAPPELSRSSLRASLGIDPARPAVLFVGRFVEKKGMVHLKQMARSMPEWNWLLAGWGSIDPLKWQLPNVYVFSNGSGASLTPLYQAADALVLPSVGEGFPLVVQEALACGLAVVCGDDTAQADPVAQQHLVGVHVDPMNPDATGAAFVRALAPLVRGAEMDYAMRIARAEFARERYSWHAMALQMVALLPAISMHTKTAGALTVSHT